MLWTKLANNYRFSLIPLHGKVPIEDGWTRWCRECRPFARHEFNGHNAGVACGPASGVIVLDVDQQDRFGILIKEKEWEVPKTFTVRSSATKYHFYYRYPTDGNFYGNSSWKEGGVTIFDIRGCGGQVVAPGSVHPITGKPYELVREIAIVQPPQWILDFSIQLDPDVPTESGIDWCDRSEWDGDIEHLPLSEETKTLIACGKDVGERSEAIMSVVNGLVWSNLSDAQIIEIFEHYPIGEKYRSKKRSKTRWIRKHIDKARRWVTNRAEPSKKFKPRENPWGKPLDVTSVTSVTSVSDVTLCNMRVTSCNISSKTPETVEQQRFAEDPGPNQDEYVKFSTTQDKSSLQVNLTDKVLDWLELSDGVFHLSEMARDLQLLSTKSLRVVLTRFVSKGLIERVGTKAGTYRKIDATFEPLKILSADKPKEYKINLPLGLSHLGVIYPGDIIVIAGESNSAKSAMALDIARMNLHDHKVRYVTTELRDESLDERLLLYDQVMNVQDWKRVEFGYKTRDFHQYVLQDDLTIIDYVEIHENFYEMGGIFRCIHDKLNKGVCVVILQKSPGKDVAKGGYVTLEKPRLYVSIGLEKAPDGSVYNVAKIIKLKVPRDKTGIDPNWMCRRFKLYGGWNIQPLGDWYHPNK